MEKTLFDKVLYIKMFITLYCSPVPIRRILVILASYVIYKSICGKYSNAMHNNCSLVRHKRKQKWDFLTIPPNKKKNHQMPFMPNIPLASFEGDIHKMIQ